MEFHILDWVNFLFRWLHVITAIAWVGASFYFVWLDLSLENPPKWKKEKGVKGDLWAFHGGGIYEVAKYELAPDKMPTTLHWFKWEAYSTWISGTLLLIVLYYFNADLYLVDSRKWITTAEGSILASMAYIGFGVIVYNALFRVFSYRQPMVFTVVFGIFIVFSCYLAVHLFSDRAAFLHVGAMIASIMAASVFFGIIPAQKHFVQLIESGDEPNLLAMQAAQRRSVINNYLTLPVLICMLSNHYPFFYGHTFNWIGLCFLMAASAYGRHYFNVKHRGEHKPSILIIAFAITLLTIVGLAYAQYHATRSLSVSGADTAEAKSDHASTKAIRDTILAATQKHCASCHSDTPSFPGINAAPLGLTFTTLDNIVAAKAIVLTSLKTRYMPLGNMTNMTDEERQALIEHIERL